MMSQIQQNILKALYLMLKPLARSLLRSGIGFREFSEVAKAAFVYEASVGYGIRGRETNISRVAIMTGLSRREVKKMRGGSPDEIVLSEDVHSPGASVLACWHTDEKFIDSNSKPMDLEYDGPPNSFCELVKKSAGDLPSVAMKKELERIGALEQLADGRLKVLKRTFIPNEVDELLAMALRASVLPLLETIDHNCISKRGAMGAFLERTAGVRQIRKSKIPLVRAFLNEKLASYTYEIDAFLERNNDLTMTDSEIISSKAIGAGFYYFETDQILW